MQPALVILAAGMGSRFGGLKQIRGVGPSGETIMDYSIFDAARAGFRKIVFIIRPDMENAFREAVGSRFEPRAEVHYAFQRADDLPAGHTPPPDRAKPWGTGHAVLAARDVVTEPFAVINADDFYGRAAFAALGESLGKASDTGIPTFVMVGYQLSATLSDAGTVNRGVCRCTDDGFLERITEIEKIARTQDGGQYTDEKGNARTLDPSAQVSMNLWGFTPVFFDHLRAGFEEFMAASGSSPTAEYYLPAAVQHLIDTGRARVRVLPGGDQWCGVTNPDDLPRVQAKIADLVNSGEYPQSIR